MHQCRDSQSRPFALTISIQMTSNLRLPDFPDAGASRALYLGQIWQQVSKVEVARLLVDLGIPQGDFKLYWHTRPPPTGVHQGFCWAEFRTRQLAVDAWARLDGLSRWNRTLKVQPVVCPSQFVLSFALVRSLSSLGKLLPRFSLPSCSLKTS